MNNKFIIPIQKLLDSEIGSMHEFDFDLNDFTIPQVTFDGETSLNGTITYLDETLLISFDSDLFTYTHACVRCLTECKQITSIDAALESFSLHTPAENDFSLLQQEKDGAVLDITPLVEQEFHLSAASNPLCKEDCLGLCPSCGCNLNKKSCDCEKQRETDNPFSQLKSIFPPK